MKPRQAVIVESWTALLAFKLASGIDLVGFREKLLRRLKLQVRDELVNDWPDYLNPHHDSLYAALRLDGLSSAQAEEYIRTVKDL